MMCPMFYKKKVIVEKPVTPSPPCLVFGQTSEIGNAPMSVETPTLPQTHSDITLFKCTLYIYE